MPVLKFIKINSKAIIPSFAKEGDAGLDLYSVEDKVLKKGSIDIISLGIASEIPSGFFVSVRDRSSLAAKYGLHVLAGVIDSGYRGEWKVVLINLGNKDYKISVGERIAQGIMQILPSVRIKEVKILKESKRGEGGFGSSGKF